MRGAWWVVRTVYGLWCVAITYRDGETPFFLAGQRWCMPLRGAGQTR